MNHRRQLKRRSPQRFPLALLNAGLSNRFVLSTFCVAALFALDLAPASAQTWVGGTLATPSPPAAPGSYSWNTPTNWSIPAAIPVAGGTAIFDAGPPTSISTLGGVSVGTLQFNAPSYTFDALDSMVIDGGGIDASPANRPTFNVIGTALGDHATPDMGFFGSSSAGTAHLILGEVVDSNNGFNAGFATFNNTSTAGQATIEVRDDGAINFLNSSTADHATLIVDNNGFLGLQDQSNGDQATVINNAGGEVKIADLTTGGTSFGSIAGAGTFNLGSNQLTVGSNNASTTVSGVIEDHFPGGGGGDGGSLVKVGAGTLTLSGANTYTGGTTINGGTLQLGDGGASGSIIGGVVDNGTLAFNRIDAIVFSGVISGTGGVAQVGPGTTTLTASNTYTGVTTVAAGTLAAGAVNTLPGLTAVTVESAGTLELAGFNQSIGSLAGAGSVTLGDANLTTGNDNTSTLFSGVISGNGALDKVGAGTFVLSGANTYAGGTTIAAGTLQLGNGVATGGIIGDVVDNGKLAFDRSDAVTFAGTISGTGSVNQIGPGSTTLTAANTYSGGTLLAAGTLIAGDNNALGTGALTVAANPTGTTLDNSAAATSLANAIVLNPSANLTVAGSNPLTLAGAISGDGALTKNGASTLILSADNSYAGGMTINAGTLQVGNGGATGSVGTGPVLDNAALVFNRSGTVTVPGAITGTGNLTQVGVAGGTLVLTGANTYSGGTTIASGILQLGNDGATGSIIGDVTNNVDLAFDHSNIFTFAGVISGPGGVAQIGSGTTILTADNPYTGGTTVSAGTLAIGDFAHSTAALSGGGPISVGSAGTLGGYGSVTGPVTNSGVIAAGSATPGFLGSPTGTFTINGNLLNQGAIQLASGESIGNVLEVRGGYIGAGGTMAINTFLGGDGSPSDRLVINGAGAAATGNTSVHVTNVGGPGAETTNGILVVNATGGATTASGAFTLANPELRAGAFDYDLFRGGAGGASPNDWFLRSTFTGGGGGGDGGGGGGGGGGGVLPPIPPFPIDPPPNPLPPSVAFPIIGPELATYGVVQPLARQLGLSILGTLDDRVGDTYEPDDCAVQPAAALAAQTSAVDLPTKKPAAVPTKKPGPAPCPLFSPSVWGRFFGQTLDNHYQAFADPRASGNLGGFQGGIDLLRGSLFAGQYERAGLYGAYGDVNSDVTGLVTNPAATAYVLAHTGSMNLDAWSAGGYWTHVGRGGWYLDAVLQGTWYYGSASTQFAKLNTDGTGFIGSLEGGYPFVWPQLGPGFVIEPQGQILWQKVSFRHDYDGEGDVALGDTTGPSGRIGLRTKWTIVTAGGQVWQPYLRGNLWRDWGAEANTVFSGTDSVPLVNQATMLEFGGGLTGRINANISVFANVDYEFAVGAANDKRNGVRGAFGARYTW